MPTRYTPTERQRRILNRLGMIRTLTNKEIHKRTGIPINELSRAGHKKLRTAEIIDIVRKSIGTPREEQLLEDIRFWQLVRICQLAHSHTANEIDQQLREEIRKKPGLKKTKRLNMAQIKLIIQKNKLRTPGEESELVSRLKTKPSNNHLTSEQRETLVMASDRYIQSIISNIRRTTPFRDTDEIRDYTIHLLRGLTRRIKLEDGMTDEHIRNRWYRFIGAESTRRHTRLAIIQKLKRVHKKGKNNRIPLEEMHANKTGREVTSEDIPPALRNKLSPRYQEIWMRLANGESQVEIAREYRLSRQRIGQIVKKIQEIIGIDS